MLIVIAIFVLNFCFERLIKSFLSGDHEKVAFAQDGIFSLPLCQLLSQDEEKQVKVLS